MEKIFSDIIVVAHIPNSTRSTKYLAENKFKG